jgi:hypothetical protein
VDYKVYGTLKIFDACKISSTERDDAGAIHVFLNFKKVAECKAKSEAVSVIKRLIAEAPSEWFEEQKEILLEDL